MNYYYYTEDINYIMNMEEENDGLAKPDSHTIFNLLNAVSIQ